MKKKFLSVLLFLLAVCAFAESPDNTSPQIFSKITLCCDIFALPVGIAALLLSMYALRFNRMEISISYRTSILEWYGKCIQTMEQLRIGKCGDKENLIARLSALSEEGRFIFPNIDKKDGENSNLLPGFQGHESTGRCYLNEFLSEVKAGAADKTLRDLRDNYTSMVFQFMKVKGFIYNVSRNLQTSCLENKSREDVEVFDVQD